MQGRDGDQLRRMIAIWGGSVVVHSLILLVLALFVAVSPAADRMILMLAPRTNPDAWDDELEVLVDLDVPEIEVEPIEELAEVESVQEHLEIALVEPPAMPKMMTVASLSPDELDFLLSSSVSPSQLLPRTQAQDATDDVVGEASGDGGAEGDRDADRGEMGGRALRRIEFSTPQVDYAINMGLIWLARHQLSDGGWSFEHRGGECRGRCPHPGDKRSARVAATGLALLPFLGAGHSPEHGEYRDVVAAGINFLLENRSRLGSLWQPEGRMYGHGIATLALCECYGVLTQSPADSTASSSRPVDLEQLRRAATAASTFIVKAQAIDGGWRYSPGELGDTSVVGWQVTALKSATDAGLGTFQPTFNAAGVFLNSVQLESAGDPIYGMTGIRYAYKPDKRRSSNATTAIGLTCRIYMGTSPYNAGMEVAVKEIGGRGPIGGDMYYNFYANQVMFQHGGPQWEAWTQRLSLGLTATQETRGHLEGSWYFGHGDLGGIAGGRLYATAMACLCLEESFRHLPVFRKNSRLRFVERLGEMERAEVEADNGIAGQPPAEN